MASKEQVYAAVITKVFKDRFKKGMTSAPFSRAELFQTGQKLGYDPKNLGDVVYAYRMRRPLPDEIIKCAPGKREWVIRLVGRGKYSFELVRQAWFIPNMALSVTKIPFATPSIIEQYALNDEQAVLARLRYNRLLDIFTGVTCYSLQNHLRTTVPNIGQIETDEVYLGVDQRGAQYIFPVQAKGGSDILSVVQVEQDFGLCEKKEFRGLIPLPIGAQMVKDEGEERIVLFAFEQSKTGITVSAEKHYQLVPSGDVSAADLAAYGERKREVL
jgi:hypothetical protein